MITNLAEASRLIKPNTFFNLANEARPGGDYLFSTFLPEQNRGDYQARAGRMIFRTVMAGLVGMDSVYPEGGFMEQSAFNEKIPKIAIAASLNEEQIRAIQQFVRDQIVQGYEKKLTTSAIASAVNLQLVKDILNFMDKNVIQSLIDTAEWMRGQALTTGGIDWTFNDKRVLVDYGIPSGNKFAARALAGGSYADSSSVFWADTRAHKRVQRQGIAAIVLHPDSADEIQYNSTNLIRAVDQTDDYRVWQKVNSLGQDTRDSNDIVRVYTYGAEAEVFDLTNRGKTKKIPFMPKNTMLVIGKAPKPGFQPGYSGVGQGSTNPIIQPLGFTHIGPTTEGGGEAGRWSRSFTPEREPWALRGEGVENLLPVIEAPELISISTWVSP